MMTDKRPIEETERVIIERAQSRRKSNHGEIGIEGLRESIDQLTIALFAAAHKRDSLAAQLATIRAETVAYDGVARLALSGRAFSHTDVCYKGGYYKHFSQQKCNCGAESANKILHDLAEHIRSLQRAEPK